MRPMTYIYYLQPRSSNKTGDPNNRRDEFRVTVVNAQKAMDAMRRVHEKYPGSQYRITNNESKYYERDDEKRYSYGGDVIIYNPLPDWNFRDELRQIAKEMGVYEGKD